MSIAVQCKPSTGVSCHNKTKDPSGRCHMHQSSIVNHAKRGRLHIPPVKSGIPTDYSARADDEGLAFQSKLIEAFPDAIVSLSGNKIEMLRPSKPTFWNRNPAPEKFSIIFTEDILDISYSRGIGRTRYAGDVDPVVRRKISDALEEVYPS